MLTIRHVKENFRMTLSWQKLCLRYRVCITGTSRDRCITDS